MVALSLMVVLVLKKTGEVSWTGMWCLLCGQAAIVVDLKCLDLPGLGPPCGLYQHS